MKQFNNKGQTLIEALIAGATTLFSMTLLLMMFYRGLVYFTARHCVNELLFCLSSLSSTQDCENDFNQRLQHIFVFKEKSKVQVRKNKNEIQVSFYVRAPGTPDMEMHREIKLPLKRNL